MKSTDSTTVTKRSGNPGLVAFQKLGAMALTVTTSLSLPLCAFAQTPTQTQAPDTTYSRPAKDFKYRKRFIAPSSDLYHRIDYASMPSRDALMLPTYEPTYGKGTGPSANRPSLNYQPIHPDAPQEALKAQAESLGNKSANIKPMANRQGLTPPPPPANQKLLPNSLSAGTASKVSNNGESAGSAPSLSAAHIAHVKAQAAALVKQGHLAEAQEMLKRTVQEHPKETVLRAELSKISLDRARFFAKQGNAQQAASQARLAIAYGSAYSNASESAYTVLASNLTKAGVDPRNPDARASIGADLLAHNNPIEAEIEYRQAIKLRPNSSDFYIGAGSAAQANGNNTSAKFDYQKALELNPDNQAALSKLGILRYQNQDYIGANADLTRALVMNGQDTAAAQALVELWQRQVNARPADATAHLGLARAYQVTGDLDSAKGEYKTVVKIDPNHPNLPAARQSFKLALARREAYKAYDSAHSLETQGQLAAAYQKASDAVELYPSESNFQAYKTQLAGQLQAAGMPVYAASGQAIQALSNLVQQGNGALPTAAASAIPVGLGTAASQLPAAATAMAADNMYRPLSTDNQVNSMSGFLSSLRNFTMQQQTQQQAYETTANQTISSIAGVPAPSGGPGAGGLAGSGLLGGGIGGSMPGEGPAAAALAAVPGFAPSNPLPGGVPSASLDQGQIVAAKRAPVTAASALQSAAQALGNTSGNGGFIGGFASTYGAAAPAAAASVTPASTGTATTLSSMALGATPAMAPSIINGLGRAASYLHQNHGSQTQTQTSGALTQAISPGSTSYGFTGSGNFATQQTMPTTMTQRTIETGPATAYSGTPNAYNPAAAPLTVNPGGNLATAQTLSASPNSDPTGQATALALAPPIASPEKSDLHSLIPPGAVKLYLTGVKATKNEVHLEVSLRNDGAVPFKIPGGVKAIIRTTGQPDQQAKVAFDSKSVASGTTVTGVIRVPGKNLDPTADIIIPTGSLTNGTIADIHLSVPISAK
ncbi:MAG: hypothetical protein KGS72_02330 [Cyanobacteria bacterium REEB67]|nr:hypothetical protein [Cyanobacteria bacterium REEB67]